ncbi:hypothetical protein VSA01S_21860 [Vibrio sagamiensis NBRC 104589]|uniref:Uncharacterized protein n=2 Tax=Vibrio sagamiensis TaxID=512650 RepID=A0A511QFK1_9VIBR|nr:hypothetical protein VSA01S_21860 [Vibrio sagamiensis NBRC 104589]
MNIVRKFISLVINRGLDSLLAIIIIPLLISRYGDVKYGLFAYLLNLSTLIIIVVRFGFENYILMSNSREDLAIRVGRVIYAKGLLLLLMTPIYFSISYFNFSNENYFSSVFLWLIVLGEVFSISHAFVVINRTVVLTLIGSLRFTFLVCLAYLYINEINSIDEFAIYYGGVFLVSGLIQFFILRYLLIFRIDMKMSSIAYVINETKYFFTAKASAILFDKLFLAFSGIILVASQFAKLDVMLKVYAFCLMMPMILTGIILNKVANVDIRRHTLLRCSPILFTLFVSILVFLFKDSITSYFFGESLPGLTLIAITALVTSISLVAGELYLVPLGLAKVNSKAISLSLAISSLIMTLMILSTKEVWLTNLLLLFLFFKIIEALIKVYYIVKSKIHF